MIGGADDPHIDGDGFVGPDGYDHAVLEDTQQLGLHVQGHVANLFEEERSLIGDFEQTLAVGVGAGKSALGMAEQLTLQKRLAQSGTVDGTKRPAAAPRIVMDGACQKLLARTGGPLNQYGRCSSAPPAARCRGCPAWLNCRRRYRQRRSHPGPFRLPPDVHAPS